MKNNKILLVGCGILQKETEWLIKKNSWDVDTVFLDSALHVNFEKLAKSLNDNLTKYEGRHIVVLYGACHPLMEKTLENAKTFRTMGQNCVDMLLGNKLFMDELLKGAYFLIEEWATRWDQIVTITFGSKNKQVIREIFQIDRKFLLCIKTPCSGDFVAEAEAASEMIGLPLRWMDVNLDHFESVLQTAITRKMREIKCLK